MGFYLPLCGIILYEFRQQQSPKPPPHQLTNSRSALPINYVTMLPFHPEILWRTFCRVSIPIGDHWCVCGHVRVWVHLVLLPINASMRTHWPASLHTCHASIHAASQLANQTAIHLSIHPFIHPSIHPSIRQCMYCVCMCSYACICILWSCTVTYFDANARLLSISLPKVMLCIILLMIWLMSQFSGKNICCI